jgi:hypothetical protein
VSSARSGPFEGEARLASIVDRDDVDDEDRDQREPLVVPVDRVDLGG